MSFFRNQRSLALLLSASALLGLLVANSPLADAINALEHTRVGFAHIGLELSVGSWVEDLLLPIFFLLVGLELKHEILHGQFKNKRRLVTPALAALFGVVVPALVYLAVTAQDAVALKGWAIPTATDITFALAVFTLFGATMPAASRTFLMAFATIDDVIAILLIAIQFGSGMQPLGLVGAAVAGVGFWWLQKSDRFAVLSWVFALVAWFFTLQSGIHPTVLGVALGLLVQSERIHRYEHRLQPFVGALVLPIFAFFATGIDLSGAASAVGTVVFLGVVLRPFGKIVGITLGALIGQRLLGSHAETSLGWRDYLAVSTLGGIGFTVSILVTNLALSDSPQSADAALLATVVSAVIAVGIGAVALRYRRFSKTA